MDAETLSETLEAFSDTKAARKVGRQVGTLRGVRGVPSGDIARIAAAAWHEDRPKLPEDATALSHLFSTAWEDGLVAIGLLGALVPDDPEGVLDLGLDWAERVDDVATADSLGWIVLGGAVAAGAGHVHGLYDHRRPEVRRMALMVGMALTPTPLEGPSAAPLRERMAMKRIQWVETAASEALSDLAARFLRDEAVAVRKAMRRVLRAWAKADPTAVAAWGDAHRTSIPKMLRPEIDRARRKAGT